MKGKPHQMPLYVQTLLAIGIGIAAGTLSPGLLPRFVFIPKVIIEAIKLLSIPLLFMAILDSILRAELKGKGIAAMFGVSAINALGAMIIGTAISNLFRPGDGFQDGLAAFSNSHASSKLANLHIRDIIVLSLQSPMILAILTALALGCALRWTGAHSRFISRTEWLLAKAMWLIEIVVKLTPIAVLISVAKVVGEQKASVFGALFAYVAFCLLGMALQIVLVYQTWIRAFAKISLKRFWKAALEPAVYAFGVNSSLATIPLTLKALDRLKISESAARLSACVGTNFNNDGILLYEVMALHFLAQAHGVHWSLGQQLLVSLLSIIATVGVAGIPEAGIIALTLVMGMFGFDTGAITLLLTVDWILARSRSSTNVLGDMTVGIAIDRIMIRRG